MSTNESATAVAVPQAEEKLGHVLRPVRGRLIAAAVLAGVGSACTLVPLAGIAHIAGIALDSIAVPAAGSATGAGSAVWSTVIVSLAGLFVGLLLVLLAEATAHFADNHLTRGLRLAAARRLAQVPLGWFTARSSGEVKQAIQDDIGTLHELTAHFYTTVGRTAGAILASLAYMFAMDWRLALVAILPYVAGIALTGSAMNFSEAQMQAFGAGQARVNDAVVEFVNGIPVIKTFGNAGRAHDSYRTAVEGFLEAFLGLLRPTIGTMAIANALMTPVMVLGVVLAAGMMFMHLGWVRPVEILPFALVAPGVSAPLMLMIFVAHGLEPARDAARRVQRLLRTPVLERPATDCCKVPHDNEIRAEHVSYAYDGAHKALDDVSFTLEPGTVTAVVGPSGAGKSTLARLLLRFFDPSDGRITLGGVDLREIDSVELYRRVGFVLQEVRLIHASVRDNIALGRPSATRQDIERVARAANIHDRILELPRGYDSVIGEDAQLSGGEQQRVSIARAILLDPPVLVLDEATAAADAESEAAIQEALSRFAKGRTLLVVAHRLDTVMHADRILVVEGGTIVEQGRHDELLARNGGYARLWALGGYQETSGAHEVEVQ
ncbi:ABC transporter ATP-binding protein [Burkholderia multivorans]|uniref:ABC transporter ATP-binding protein n=1 Tax=Burkholderia multivorans TaxID=87883 RepID=UPI0004F8AFD1|nr:ABC transporter ATP-binding protein [Burkholderia multivorans]AIO73253.1 ABC transporter family protein [Burkholderia multivorans]MBU9386193.1 ABC transporter ATP-binding protein/permease [Burkholderia multivorans]MBY4791730.1 ABC transporter ATP-binding protein/permease [Burkholderia multivorans]PRE70497.1 ABC transporter ATP-binding protein [Burkholderia multivorans]PRE77138.1 ABC transporter ATP-binding protein [Burkholderia multivorans]